MAEVSVVLPVFNGAATIERAVQSVLHQDFRDLELIVVDDGSTDDTASRLYTLRDPRLRVIRQPHRGVAAAANTGAEIASAPLIARMDADDVSHPRRVRQQVQLLRQSDLDVVGCSVRIVDQSSQSVASLQRYEKWINDETVKAEDILALRFVELPLVNPTILARRNYFELGFREGDFPEDYELLLRAAHKSYRFGKVREVLFDWHDHPGRLTRTDSRYSAKAFDNCKRQYLLRGPLSRVPEVDVWGIGTTGKPWLVWLSTHSIDVRHGYDINERKLGTEVHGVTVQHPSCLPYADGTPLLIAVGAEGAREVIRPQVESLGYRIGGDAWFLA